MLNKKISLAKRLPIFDRKCHENCKIEFYGPFNFVINKRHLHELVMSHIFGFWIMKS